MLVLTRQKLPVFDRSKVAPAKGLLKGAYILSKEHKDSPDIILMATGSEVQLILGAQEKLQKEDISTRVVSMPCWEIFEQQSEDYRDEVLPKQVKKRLAVEAGASFGWCRWTGDSGAVIGVDKFGSSAPAKENFRHYGFTIENVVDRAKEVISD